MIDEQNFFDQPIKSNIRTYSGILKFMKGERDDYTTIYLLFYPYFNEHYKMVALYLSKHQALDADLKAIQQINFIANLFRAENTTIFFIIQEAKKLF